MSTSTDVIIRPLHSRGTKALWQITRLEGMIETTEPGQDIGTLLRQSALNIVDQWPLLQ